MRIKDLFTVAKGQKIMERQLLRVLTASICSILLCMSCLAGTTWALFTVNIKSTDNVIWIGKPEIVLKVDDGDFASGTPLAADSHKVSIVHANEQLDDLDRKSTLYVTLTIQKENEEPINAYVTLNHENEYKAALEIRDGKDAVLTWEVSWFAPPNAIELIDGVLTVPDSEDEEETTDSTETEPSETETEPAETEPSETETEPAETEPSETETEPAETEPSETETEPAETEPSETETEPAETEPPETETEPAETEHAEEVTKPAETESTNESVT